MLGLTSFGAAEFSFFLSIPTMIGVALINIIKVDWSKINSLEIFALAIGFIVSFIVALLVVEKFMNFLKKKPMRVFSLYRILMGIILLILIAVRVV
jgi:undecaprenyl-diphosphatase